MVDRTEMDYQQDPDEVWYLERAVRDFEKKIQEGQRQKIETYLQEFERHARSQFLKALIASEVRFLTSIGETVDFHEYKERFPDASETVDNALAAVSSTTVGPAPTIAFDTLDNVDDETHEWQSGNPLAPATINENERYQVRALHASGGLGEVYLAEDSQLVRDVALKQIKQQYADDVGPRSRFIREAQLTGRLEHPGVVPLHGMGIFPDGRPFYVMRFIRGDSLRDRIHEFHTCRVTDRERKLALRQLLARFVDVCQTMDYSHSRRIIHRDIKPANIMLGDFGETLVVDWGLARVLDERDDSATASAGSEENPDDSGATAAGEVLGTPTYMSPEQAIGNQAEVGPASDIYSLGATLFELLTGERPMDGTVMEVLEKTRRGEVRLARQVKPEVHPALDAICHRAMSYKPEDRYSSAGDLARDVEAWLADEPVSAWEEPWRIRAARFLRQHTAMVTGALTAILVTLTASAIALLIVSQKNAQLDQSNAELIAANKLAQENEELAEANYEKARDVVEQFLTDVSQSRELLAGTPGTHELRITLLDQARAYFEDFLTLNQSSQARRDVAGANRTLGQILYQIDDVPRAQEHLEAAVAMLHQLVDKDELAQLELAMAYNELAKVRFMLADNPASEAAYNASLAQFEAIGWEKLQGTGREAWAQVYTNRGALFQELSRIDNAAESYEESIRLWERLLEERPNDPELLGELAVVLTNQSFLLKTTGQFPKAEENLLRAVEILDGLPDPETGKFAKPLATALDHLGDLYRDQNRMAEAEARRRRSLQILLRLSDLNPRVVDYKDSVAGSYNALGLILSATGRGAEARRAFEDAVRIREELIAQAPSVGEYSDNLASTYNNLATHIREESDAGEAEAYYHKSLDLRIGMAEGDRSPDKLDSLASSYHNLAEYYRVMRRWKDSRDMFTKAVSIRQGLVEQSPDNISFEKALTASLMQGMGPLVELKEYEEAEAWIDEAMSRLETIVNSEAVTADLRKMLAGAYNNSAYLYSRIGRSKEAVEPLLGSKGIYETLIETDPSVIAYHSGLATCCNNLGAIYWYEKQFDESEAMFLRAAQAHDALVTAYPDNSGHRSNAAHSYRNLAALFLNQKERAEDAARYMQKSIGYLRHLVKNEPDVPPYRLRLASNLSALGLAEKRAGNYQQALDHYKEVAEVCQAPAANLQAEIEKARWLAQVRTAWLRATCPDEAFRDGPQAVTIAAAACEHSEYKNKHHLDALAAALAETGEFEKAIQRQQEALALSREEDKEKGEPSKTTKEFEARLQLYQDGKPHRDE